MSRVVDGATKAMGDAPIPLPSFDSPRLVKDGGGGLEYGEL